MRFISKNTYSQLFSFGSAIELRRFQKVRKQEGTIFLDSSIGETAHCYVGYDSLNSEELFSISFFSDCNSENFIFLDWEEAGAHVLDNGEELFFVDKITRLVKSTPIIGTLVGVHLTSYGKLLVLDEGTVRVLDERFELVVTEKYNFLGDYFIEGDDLHFNAGNKMRVLKLS